MTNMLCLNRQRNRFIKYGSHIEIAKIVLFDSMDFVFQLHVGWGFNGFCNRWNV